MGLKVNETSRIAALEKAYHHLRLRKGLSTLSAGVFFCGCVVGASIVTEITPMRIIDGIPGLGDYIGELAPAIALSTVFTDIAVWFEDGLKWLILLFDTLLIAIFASLTGVVGGMILAFPGSRNLTGSRLIYFIARRTGEIARTIPEVVYALIFVVAFGVGPFAGYLALALHSIGALAKLYAEVNENVDDGALDGLLAAGANWFEVIRYAVLPQVLPGYTTYTLWRVELNLRAAAIVGFVGAGGIGQELHTAISLNRYHDISGILLMLIATVIVLDLTSEWLRNRLLGREK